MWSSLSEEGAMEDDNAARDNEPQTFSTPPGERTSTSPAPGASDGTLRGCYTTVAEPPDRQQGSFELEEVDMEGLLSALKSSASSASSASGARRNHVLAPQEKRERERAMAAKRRTKYRQRVQEERKWLEHQKTALSVQLAALQRSKASVDASIVSTTRWETIATHQLTARLMAEDRQLQLREAVARHAAAIQRLRAMLLTHERTKRSNPVDQAPNQSDIADTVMLEGFLQELGALYAQTDAVLSACGLGCTPTPPSSYYKPRRRQDEQAGEFLESTASFTLPFDFAQLSWAVWHCLRRFQRLDDRTSRLDGVEDAANTLAATFDMDVYQHEGVNVALTYNMAVRRYVEPSRTVFVWRALTEGNDACAGFYIDETSWCVLQPSTEPGSTLVQSCLRYVPTHLRGHEGLAASPGQQSQEKVAEGDLTELVLKAWDDVMFDLMRMMEHVIVDEVASADSDMVGVERQS